MFPKERKWDYKILSDLRLVVVYYHGSVSIDDMIEFALFISTQENYNKEYNQLIDFRESDVEINPKDIKKWIEFLKNNPRFIGYRKTAFLTAKPIDVVVATLYREWKGNLPIDINDFSTLRAAIQWINFPFDVSEIISYTIDSLKQEFQCNNQF